MRCKRQPLLDEWCDWAYMQGLTANYTWWVFRNYRHVE